MSVDTYLRNKRLRRKRRKRARRAPAPDTHQRQRRSAPRRSVPRRKRRLSAPDTHLRQRGKAKRINRQSQQVRQRERRRTRAKDRRQRQQQRAAWQLAVRNRQRAGKPAKRYFAFGPIGSVKVGERRLSKGKLAPGGGRAKKDGLDLEDFLPGPVSRLLSKSDPARVLDPTGIKRREAKRHPKLTVPRVKRGAERAQKAQLDIAKFLGNPKKMGRLGRALFFETPRAVVEKPEKTGKSAAKSVPDLLAGAIPGTVEFFADPGRVAKEMGEEFERVYGPPVSKGDFKRYRREVQENPIPRFLDALAVFSLQGRAATLGLRASPGLRRAVTKERPRIQYAPGVTRRQRKSRNAFVLAGQRAADKLRPRVGPRALRTRKGGRRVVLDQPVRPIELPLVPKRLQKSTRKAKKHLRSEVARARIQGNVLLEHELGGVRRTIRGLKLRPKQARALRSVVEYGLPADMRAARPIIEERMSQIRGVRDERVEKGRPVQLQEGFDELEDLEFLLRNPEALTPKVRKAANEMRERMEKLADENPILPRDAAELRRVAPMARLFGQVRGGKARRQRIKELDRELKKAKRRRETLRRRELHSRGQAEALSRVADRPRRRRDEVYRKAAFANKMASIALSRARRGYRNAYEGAPRLYTDEERDRALDRLDRAEDVAAATKDLFDAAKADLEARSEQAAGVRASGALDRLEREVLKLPDDDGPLGELKRGLSQRVADLRNLAEIGRQPAGKMNKLERARSELTLQETKIRRLEEELQQVRRTPAGTVFDEESVADFVRRVEGRGAEEGLERPGYFPHVGPKDQLSRDVEFVQSLLRPGDRKRTTYELLDTGTAASDPSMLLRGVASNVRNRVFFSFLRDHAARLSYPGARGLTKTQVLAFLQQRGMKPSDVRVWNEGRYKDAFRGIREDKALSADDLDKAALDAMPTWESFLRSQDGDGTWSVLPKSTGDELMDLLKVGQPNRLQRALTVFLKSAPSRVILGSNPSWALLQVFNNVYLAALAGVGPVTLAKSVYFFSRNPDLRRAAAPFVGATPFGSEIRVSRLGSSLRSVNEELGRMSDALLQRPFVEMMAVRGNPLNWLFMFDRLQTDHIRRALLFKEANRVAWDRMGLSMQEFYRNMREFRSVFAMPTREAFQKLLQDRDTMIEASEHVDEMLGNYTRFGRYERAILERNILFYGFLRFSLRFAFYTMPKRHPVLASIQTNLSKLHEDEVRRLLGLLPDDPLPPWALATSYTLDGNELKALPLTRVSPFMNPLTQASGPNQLLGMLSPWLAELANQMAEKNIFFDEPWRIQGETVERRDKPYPLEDRLRIAAGNLLRMFGPYRAADDIRTGGRPQGADSLLGDRPTQYSDEEIATATELSGRRYDRLPLFSADFENIGKFLAAPRDSKLGRYLFGVTQRYSPAREVATGYLERREAIDPISLERRQFEDQRRFMREFGPEYFQAMREQTKKITRRQIEKEKKQARKEIKQFRERMNERRRRSGSDAGASRRSYGLKRVASAQPAGGSAQQVYGGAAPSAPVVVPSGGGGGGREPTSSERRIIEAAANRHGIDAALLWGVYGAESGFGTNTGPSSAGAQGPFQFMPATARQYGINPHNFRQAANAAAKYLATYMDRGAEGALAAYNAGPAGNPNNPETRQYIPKVLSLAESWSGGSPSARTSSTRSEPTTSYRLGFRNVRDEPSVDMDALLIDSLLSRRSRGRSLLRDITGRLDSGAYRIPGEIQRRPILVPVERRRRDGDEPQDVSSGGGWGGSKGVADTAIRVARQLGVPAGSQKRSRKRTVTGSVSDHWIGNTTAYAVDFPARGAAGDRLAREISRAYGMPYRPGQWVNRNVRVGNRVYRVQIGWRTPGHDDHVHVGVKLVG